MIKVLAVVVIAGGLYWFMSGGDGEAECTEAGGTWHAAVEEVKDADGNVTTAAKDAYCEEKAEETGGN